MEFPTTSREPIERFVDDERAAEFLSLTSRHVKELARAGLLQAYPLGLGQKRFIWRFKLSELSEALTVRRANRKA